MPSLLDKRHSSAAVPQEFVQSVLRSYLELLLLPLSGKTPNLPVHPRFPSSFDAAERRVAPRQRIRWSSASQKKQAEILGWRICWLHLALQNRYSHLRQRSVVACTRASAAWISNPVLPAHLLPSHGVVPFVLDDPVCLTSDVPGTRPG